MVREANGAGVHHQEALVSEAELRRGVWDPMNPQNQETRDEASQPTTRDSRGQLEDVYLRLDRHIRL